MSKAASLAAQLRAMLAEAYPQYPRMFGVYSESWRSGGGRIEVYWSDGPTEMLVEALLKPTTKGFSLKMWRTLSIPFLERVAQAYCAPFGWGVPKILKHQDGSVLGAYVERYYVGRLNLQQRITKAAHQLCQEELDGLVYSWHSGEMARLKSDQSQESTSKERELHS